LLGWPRSALAQFAYLGAVAVGLALLLVVIAGFRYRWDFPVNPYRERYFFDDSTVHTTDWKVAGVGDVDSDGASDLLVSLPFDPEREDCRMSAWILSGRTGGALLRLTGPQGGFASPGQVAMVGGCSAFGVEPLGERLDAPGPVLALTSFVGSEYRGRVFELALRDRKVVRVYSGMRESENFGWAAACVGDLDGDGARDLVVSSRSSSLVRACSRASGETLWSIASSQIERAEAEDKVEWPSPNWIDEIQSLEDVDGDGVTDVALASPWSASYRGSVFLISGRTGTILSRVDGELETRRGVPSNMIGSPFEAVHDQDGDQIDDLLVGSLTLPSRILSVRTRSWMPLPRPLFRARPAGDVDDDGHEDFVGSERHDWDPEEAVVVSGTDGRVLMRFRPEKGFRFLSGWRAVGDQDGDGREDLAVVSDNELESGWGCYSWSPGFGSVTVYSGRDGSVIRRIDREALQEFARRGIEEWSVQ
jgi:hypothetical protein